LLLLLRLVLLLLQLVLLQLVVLLLQLVVLLLQLMVQMLLAKHKQRREHHEAPQHLLPHPPHPRRPGPSHRMLATSLVCRTSQDPHRPQDLQLMEKPSAESSEQTEQPEASEELAARLEARPEAARLQQAAQPGLQRLQQAARPGLQQAARPGLQQAARPPENSQTPRHRAQQPMLRELPMSLQLDRLQTCW
jgi:FtsZ-interacting cell division protein ZipA